MRFTSYPYCMPIFSLWRNLCRSPFRELVCILIPLPLELALNSDQIQPISTCNLLDYCSRIRHQPRRDVFPTQCVNVGADRFRLLCCILSQQCPCIFLIPKNFSLEYFVVINQSKEVLILIPWAASTCSNRYLLLGYVLEPYCDSEIILLLSRSTLY